MSVFFTCLLVGLRFFGVSNGASVATFTNAKTGIDGTVSVGNGVVTVTLDLSNMNKTKLPSNCFDAGMKYHIHKIWTHSDGDEKIGAIDCGKSFTGGHWDPWNACGGASGSDYCGCFEDADYKCNKTNFDKDPFVCEVGDWSGKYGVLTIDSSNKVSRTDQSYFEVEDSEIGGKSVVFHCTTTGGPRAFCGKFSTSDDMKKITLLQSTNVNKVKASFNAKNYIELQSDGKVNIAFDFTEYSSEVNNSGCTSYEYSIFEKFNGLQTSDTFYLNDTECNKAIGNLYDPTSSCYSSALDGDSDKCFGDANKLCNISSYSYNCQFSTQRFSCAPGDLSGKYGVFDTKNSKKFSKTATDYTLPLMSSIAGKSVGVYCDNGKFFGCAKFVENDESGAVGLILFFNHCGCFIFVLAMLRIIF